MYCTKISYKNYRNIETAVIEPIKGVNVFHGDNAQGKTNLLEGIYYFACGKSFRGAKDRELIRFGEENASISLEFTDSVRERDHRILFSQTERKACFKEGIKINRMSEFIGSFRAVLFSPEHLSIVKDGPSERRTFLDVAISQLYPVYMASLSRYQKILVQRNACIKDREEGRFSEDMFRVLSEQLARESALISEYRQKYVLKLSEHVGNIISDMTCGKEKAELIYDGRGGEKEYLDCLTLNNEKEFRAGVTLYGPHKDDITILLNGKDSRSFASQGQQRSIALSMKLSEGEISKEITGEYPVFLFDDILSELDRKRKEYILSGLEGRQVIITCCEDIPKGHIFGVKSGSVVS